MGTLELPPQGCEVHGERHGARTLSHLYSRVLSPVSDRGVSGYIYPRVDVRPPPVTEGRCRVEILATVGRGGTIETDP